VVRGIAAVIVTSGLLACSSAGDGRASSSSGAASTSTSGTPSTTSTTTARPAGGAPGVDDPYFPDLGNGGYDVGHYDLDLFVAPDGNVEATATITAKATQALGAFDLDLRGLEVRSVTVDAAAATYERHDREVVITPAAPVDAGTPFTTVVTYGGTPEPVSTDAVGGALVGWQRNRGGSFVMAEPEGASTWFPSNDHPSDKATFTIHVTVPAGTDVAANGERTANDDVAGATRSTFEMPEPMATYLATVVVGHFDVRTASGPAGITIRDVYPAGRADELAPVFATQADMLGYFATVFGPYPFAVYGALVTDGLGGLDFEAQTMSLFGGAVDEEIVAHELVHQWFGDSVSVQAWDDIWLAEGFATFGSWLWEEHGGGRTTAQRARQQRRADLGPIRDPGREGMFDDNVYDRGALTLEALRETIGDDVFFRTLSTYATRFRGGNVTTEDFIAVAEEVSGQPLASLFDPWLDAPGPPELPQ